jgi:hypothetical protein
MSARTHMLLVDLVNDAETQWQHDHHSAYLAGWRAGLEYGGLRWSGIEADLHTMARFGQDRPMCCGELMDWKPK